MLAAQSNNTAQSNSYIRSINQILNIYIIIKNIHSTVKNKKPNQRNKIKERKGISMLNLYKYVLLK